MAREKRLVRRAKKNKPIRQVAAIPYRMTAAGGIEVLLVTSNTTRRFIVPKGWPMKSKTGREAAAQEAFEEAGVDGVVTAKPFGAYMYWKRLSGTFVKVNVKVFLLAVDGVRADWEEQGKRARAWLSPADAASLIDEPELAALVLSLEGRTEDDLSAERLTGKAASGKPPKRKASKDKAAMATAGKQPAGKMIGRSTVKKAKPAKKRIAGPRDAS